MKYFYSVHILLCIYLKKGKIFTKLSNLTSFWMLFQGLLKYVLDTSRCPSMGLFVFPLVVLKGLLPCMRPSGEVGAVGVCCHFVGPFYEAACCLEGQKKFCCCILAWTKMSLSIQHNFLLYAVLENNRKCLEITEESLLISNCKNSFHHSCHFKAWFSYVINAPATWLPVLPGIQFWYENRCGRQHWSSQSLPLVCLQSWLKFDFAGMVVVELCDGSSCWQHMFLFIQEVS